MTTESMRDMLSRIGACKEAVEWVGERDLATAWRECDRADWMLWLLAKRAGNPHWPTRQQVVLAACACAETALHHVPADEPRPRIAIKTARRWANGCATIDEGAAARAACAYDAAAYAAACAAAACAYAAGIAAGIAAAFDSDACADALKTMAQLVRDMVCPAECEVIETPGGTV